VVTYYETIEYQDRIPIKAMIVSINEFDPHWHDELEIIYILDGSIKLNVAGEVYAMNKEDIAVVNSKEVHFFQNEGRNNSLLVIQFSMDVLKGFDKNLERVKFRCNSSFLTDNRYAPSYEIIKTCLARIFWEIRNRNIAYLFQIHSQINTIITGLYRDFPYIIMGQESIDINNEDLKRMDRIFSYVEQHFMKPISIRDIANKEYLSVYYLSHLFKERVGISFGKYVTIKRFESAKKQLLATNKSISEVATDCGFKNVKSFYSIFKEREKCTPLEYRDSKKGNKQGKNEDSIQDNNAYNFNKAGYLDIDNTSALNSLYARLGVPDNYYSKGGSLEMSILKVNANQNGESFVPFWKKCVCAGRAGEGMRQDWRQQLNELQSEIGFEYIRFHGIFHEDMMVYSEREDGTPVYNWQYIDNLFDYLLGRNIRPLLELGFMPYALASGKDTVFWWKGNVTPPRDYNKWGELICELVRHCINRYGINEILMWYFEVWNEPDQIRSFWYGTREEYFKLYEYTVNAIKSVDSRLKVGGPATAASHGKKAPWLVEFLEFCEDKKLPVDFISTHPYPSLWPLDDKGNCVMAYREVDSTYNDLVEIRKTLENSAYRNAEIHLTEWNSSPSPRDMVHDTAFMAPFIIKNNLQCIGLADSLGFWAFTDIFEEGGAGESIFHGGFGLINVQGLKKPAYYGYWFLSKLGNEKLASGENYFITRGSGKIQVLMWNYCHYNEKFSNGDRSELTEHHRYNIFKEKSEISFDLSIEGVEGKYRVIDYVLDREHGSVFDEWLRNGAPANPTGEELAILNKKSGPEGKISVADCNGSFSRAITVKPHGVVFIELQKMY